MHPLLDPGLQIWIAEVGDHERRLLAGAESLGIADAGVGGIIAHRIGPARDGSEFNIEREPPGSVRREIGRRRLCRDASGQGGVDEPRYDAADKLLSLR